MATLPLTFDAQLPSVSLAQSEMSVVVAKNVSWDASLPSIGLTSEVSLIYAALDVAPFVQLCDAGLLGGMDMVPGPGDTVVVAGRESRELLYVLYSDLRYLQVVGRHKLSGRPLAIASSRLMPNGSVNGEGYIFCVVEESANAPRKLLVLDMTPEPTVLAERTLPQDSDPNFIWADNRAEDNASFVVVTGGRGSVELRTADPELNLLTCHETGLAEPQVIECFRRTDLETERDGYSAQIWHIILFSHTAARAICLEYRHTTLSRKIRIPAPGLVWDAALPDIFAATDIVLTGTFAVDFDSGLPAVELSSAVYVSQDIDVTFDASLPGVTVESEVVNASLFIITADADLPEVSLSSDISVVGA